MKAVTVTSGLDRETFHNADTSVTASGALRIAEHEAYTGKLAGVTPKLKRVVYIKFWDTAVETDEPASDTISAP